MRTTLLVLASFVAACHVSAEAKTGTNGTNASASMEGNESFSANEQSAATKPAAATTQAAPAPVAPPADACPLSCYVASGAEAFPVSDQEAASIRSALEPTLASMRSCVQSPGAWRRHGSPVLHLRVAPDGQVFEVDVDPHHHYDYERQCIDRAAGTGVSLSLPGRFAVRCSERCVAPKTVNSTRRRR